MHLHRDTRSLLPGAHDARGHLQLVPPKAFDTPDLKDAKALLEELRSPS